MGTRLIQLEDGILVAVDVPGELVEPIAGGMAHKVSTTFDSIQPTLVNVCKPIVAAWEEINRDVGIKKAVVEIGLSFEGEGNVYVTKAKAGANLTVKLVLKPKDGTGFRE